MSTMKQRIREYVTRKNTITLNEVINRISTEEHIQTTYTSIRSTLYLVRKELYIEPPAIEAEKIIRKYVKKHNNFVSFNEVKNYILKKKRIKLKDNTIREILRRVLKESKGKLKSSGMKQILREYVKAQDRIVTFEEAKEYLLTKKKIKASDPTIRNTLYVISKELGIYVKGVTLKEIIRDYVQVHQNEVTFKELKNYILNDKQIKASESSIRSMGREILAETGRTFSKKTVAGVIRDYLKEHNGETVKFKEVESYILNETDIKTTQKTIAGTFYRVRKEFIVKN